MANTNVMLSADTMSSSLAECYLDIDGKRYNFMQAIDLEAKYKKTKKKVSILGKPGGGNKATGWEGTGKAKFHYNTSIFRKLILDFMATGKDIYFDIQIINEDPNSAAGRQSITLLGCNIDSGVLAKFDASGEVLEEEVEFTFESATMAEAFTDLTGMTV